MKIKARIPQNNPIHDEFNGRIGELIALNNKSCNVRIEYDHSYVILTLPWGHSEVLE